MQKKLIVAALAGMVAAPFAAQAQSSVEVYGILGVGYKAVEKKVEETDKDAVKTKTTETGANGQNSGSRLGFRGTEDLGNGLKAGFTVEYGIDPTENNALGGASASLLTRQAFASLSGGFGGVRIGRQNSLNKNLNDSFTAFGGAGFATGWTTDVQGYTNATDRQNNTIQYVTPDFSGLTASVQLTKETADTDNLKGERQQANGNRLGLNYSAGPIAAAYVHSNMKYEKEESAAVTAADATSLKEKVTAAAMGSTPATARITVKTDSLGASYDFGAAKLFLTHNREKAETVGAGEAKKNDTVVGVRVPFGSTSVWAQYGKGKDENATGTAKNDIKGYQLGALYTLSKRTSVFGFYGDDEKKVTTGDYKKTSNDGFTLGLQHSF